MVVLGDQVGASRKVLIAALAAIAAGMLWNTFWASIIPASSGNGGVGPTDCSGALENLGSAGNLAKTLQTMSVVRCDEAAWRFLGLSLAGYNALISLTLAAIAIWGVVMERRSPAAYPD